MKESKNIKIIAFHLPQYHIIKENEVWYGEGFTDWTNVKNARGLYKGHNQPRIPLDGKYYDLKEIEELKWQSQVAQKYNIYGFCYYHYWFNGKKLLEKPIEILLDNKEITSNFCLCWANEGWKRTWGSGNRNEVLIEQNYGEKGDWIKHIDYLISFFEDDRYIKIDGRPLLILYNTKTIPCLKEMVKCWNEECKKRNIKEIYIVSENNSYQNDYEDGISDAVLDFEPMCTIQFGRSFGRKVWDRLLYTIKDIIGKNRIHFYDYDHLWENIISRKYNDKKKHYLGAFVDWDNTPRKGKNGVVVLNGSVEKFTKYLGKQLKKAQSMGSDLIFINAWNEWAEGTYLEPDEKNGYGYLEAIKTLLDDL